MGVTPTEGHDDGGQGPYPGGETPPTEAPTSQLLSGAVGDRCPNCGAPLASDQRYCVQCGERRGQSRFSAAAMSVPPTRAANVPASPPQPPHRRPASGATVVAGIATLVLALGVGVEIGRIANSNGSASRAAAAPQVITVNGGGGGGSGGQSTRTVGGSSAAPKTHHHAAPPPKTEAKKAQAAAAQSKPTQKAVQKASHAASGVLGGSGGQSNNTVTSGQSCASGSAGCQGGHFTGNFFGQ
jgi:hypothetical protein